MFYLKKANSTSACSYGTYIAQPCTPFYAKNTILCL